MTLLEVATKGKSITRKLAGLWRHFLMSRIVYSNTYKVKETYQEPRKD